MIRVLILALPAAVWGVATVCAQTPQALVGRWTHSTCADWIEFRLDGSNLTYNETRPAANGYPFEPAVVGSGPAGTIVVTIPKADGFEFTITFIDQNSFKTSERFTRGLLVGKPPLSFVYRRC